MIGSRLAFAILVAAAAVSAQAQSLAITNARIATAGPLGTIEQGTVIVRDGRIAAVGRNVTLPAGVETIDAAGRTVTPGLIAAGTGLGLLEVRSVGAANDRATRSSWISAAMDVADGLNPDSMLIPVARLGGITSAVLAIAMWRFNRGNIFD